MSKEFDSEYIKMSKTLKNSVEFLTNKLDSPEIRAQLSEDGVSEIVDNLQAMISTLIPTGMKLAGSKSR